MADMLDDLLFPGGDIIEDAPATLDTLEAPRRDAGGLGSALQSIDAPVPGQSLTQSPESPLPYEMPPQFTNEDEAAHAIFMALTEKEQLSQVLQMLDAGVPVSLIAQSVIMFGASEGKWNMDLALLLLEPTMVMIAGVGSQAGINFSMAPPEKDPEVLDTSSLKKIFKDKLGKKKDALGDEDAKKASEQVASMIKRPDSEASPMPDTGQEPMLTPKGVI